MEAPPSFAPPPPRKQTNVVLIVVLSLVGAIVICCGGAIGLGLYGLNKFKGSIGCVIHFTMAEEALKKYSEAHGGKLPDASKWQDEILPYYKNATTDSGGAGKIFDFGDPAGDLGCKGENGSPSTGMAFNAKLSKVSAGDHFGDVVLFEVPETGRNLHKPYKPIPGEAPQKIMDKPRPWITVTVGGNANIGNNSNINISN